MGVYIDFCRTRWRLRETSYSNESEATLEYGGWEAEPYSELLSTGIDVSQRGQSRVNIDIPEQILRQTTRFRFDIRGCDGQTHHGYEQRAISSDEFRQDWHRDRRWTRRYYSRVSRVPSFLPSTATKTRDRLVSRGITATATTTARAASIIAEMPTDNETVKQSVFEVEGQEQQQKLGELQSSLAASEMPASSAHQQPAAPVELPGSIPRTT
ncbi:hypothetical protein GTR04_2256 [Trichophyton interdigitale]|nr:hypothetical protein GY632_5424 [Trichophyton interdigitale]KAG8210370.1 hypothetical protein GTR04_2256 [Trichophyton interdigitale]